MQKYTLSNVSGRDLTFVRPVTLRLKAGEEKAVFLSDPQAAAFRQNPGEVKLTVEKKPEPSRDKTAEIRDSGPAAAPDPTTPRDTLSPEVEKEELPEPGTKKGRR